MKAVIVEKRKRYAAALSEDGRIIKIKDKNYEVGQTIIINKNSKYIKMAVSVAAVFMIFAAPAYAYLTPYSYVSIDVNPSFEFSINRFDRVLEVNAFNMDGVEALKDVDIKGLKNREIKEAVINILNKLQDDGYLTEGGEGEVVVATSSRTKKKTDELASSLKSVINKEVNYQHNKIIEDEEVTEKLEEKIEEDANNDVIKESDSNPVVEDIPQENIDAVEENITEGSATTENKNEADEKEIKKAENNKSGIKVKVIGVGKEMVEEAHKLDLTPGKLNLIEKLIDAGKKAGADEKLENWVNESIKNITEQTKEYIKEAREKEKAKYKENKEKNETKETFIKDNYNKNNSDKKDNDNKKDNDDKKYNNDKRDNDDRKDNRNKKDNKGNKNNNYNKDNSSNKNRGNKKR